MGRDTPWCVRHCSVTASFANRNVESETYIETGDLKGGGAFVLHRPGEEPICLTSIGDLLAKLHEISF